MKKYILTSVFIKYIYYIITFLIKYIFFNKMLFYKVV